MKHCVCVLGGGYKSVYPMKTNPYDPKSRFSSKNVFCFLDIFEYDMCTAHLQEDSLYSVSLIFTHACCISQEWSLVLLIMCIKPPCLSYTKQILTHMLPWDYAVSQCSFSCCQQLVGQERIRRTAVGFSGTR